MDESIRTGRLAGLKQVQESMKSAWLNDTQSDAIVGVEEPSRGSLIDVMMSDEPGAARNLFASYESGTVLTSEYGRFGIKKFGKSKNEKMVGSFCPHLERRHSVFRLWGVGGFFDSRISGAVDSSQQNFF